MRVAIYGGAFDPPHVGHLHVIHLLQQSGDFDEVWITPTGKREDKPQNASAQDRLTMAELLVADIANVRVCPLQIQEPEAPTTTLLFSRFLKEQYPNYEFEFVIGSELVSDLPNWRDAEMLEKEVAFVVVPRPGAPQKLSSDFRIRDLTSELSNVSINLSSSDVRRFLANGMPVDAYVPSLVLQHIKLEGLYGLLASSSTTTVFRGKFISACIEDRWEYVDRVGSTSTVGVVAVTDGHLILVEQYRPPRKKQVIELPAGLVGDGENSSESVETAAARELLEETGYRAKGFKRIGEGPTTAGLSSEFTNLVVAEGLEKVSSGGGDGSEDITVHRVPLKKLAAWLKQKQSAGFEIDLKVYTALYFCLNCDSL